MQHYINQNIRALRLLLGLTQSEFGKPLGLGGTAISHIEGGRREVRAELVDRLRDVYGVQPERIYAKDFVAALQRGVDGLEAK